MGIEQFRARAEARFIPRPEPLVLVKATAANWLFEGQRVVPGRVYEVGESTAAALEVAGKVSRL